MPSYPPPKSIEFSRKNTVAMSVNPFSGAQQTQDWGGAWLEMTVTMQPMGEDKAKEWIDFFIALKGQSNVFQLTNSVFSYRIPDSANSTGYYRLASNDVKWSVSEGLIYGLKFDIREAF